MKITIMGSGYVGLVTGACFADLGNQVTCIDINKNKIAKLKKSKVPFFEPGLNEIIARNLKEARLSFTSSNKSISNSEILFLCIDTPKGKSGKPDLTNLNHAIDTIKLNISASILIVTKSTVPLGTNKKILHKLSPVAKNKDFKIDVCSNPEFLKEGSAVNDFMRPERIILGADSVNSFNTLRTLYKPLNRKSNKIIEMSLESAELTKYAANAFLATKISFINQIAGIAEATGANIHEVRQGIGTDSRIGKDFLYAGLGYGGSCFPKDIQALIKMQEDFGINSTLLHAVEQINLNQVSIFLQKIKDFYKTELKTKTLVVWGLSFKPNTDDVRDSVAVSCIKLLSKLVENIYVYDPIVRKLPKELSNIKNISSLKSQYSKISECNALIICTEWKQFWEPDIASIMKLKDGVIFDGRNILDANLLSDNGLKYIGIGTSTT